MAAPASAPAQPILVELFTSQGCSSCPPADELLRRLGGAERAGRPIIALAFHVDYWNDLGWSDPFSQAAWSERQRAYARRIAQDRSYTPQLVVHGRAHAVGSRPSEVDRAVAEVAAAIADDAPVHLHAEVSRLEPTRDRLRITAQAELAGSPSGKRPAAGKLEIWVAVYESGIRTQVRAGENAGAQLRNDYIVRALKRAFVIGPKQTRGSAAVTVDRDPSWQRDKLGVVVFAQDPETMKIYGAAGPQPIVTP